MTDTLVTQRRLPWYGRATQLVDGLLTAEAALEAAGLNWDVELRSNRYSYNEGGKTKTKKSRARSVVRTDSFDEIGVVGGEYVPFQNRQAFAFLDRIVGDGSMIFDSAGTRKGGAEVFIVARAADSIEVAGDEHVPYMFFMMAHDGSRSVTATPTVIRPACTNMFRGILGRSQSIFRRRHIAAHVMDEETMAEAARTTLGVHRQSIEKFAVIAQDLVRVSVDEDVFEAVMAKATPWDDSSTDKMIANIKHTWLNSDTIPDQRFTGWGVLNAVTEYMDHVRPWRGDDAKFLNTLGKLGAEMEEWTTRELLKV